MQVPAHIAARVAARQQGGANSAVLDSVLSGGKFPYPKISIRAGRFRLVEDGSEATVGITLPVVIVGANPHVSKTFYARPYDPNAVDARPDCFSNDGIVPDPSAQFPVSKSCSSCPNNVLGSKITPSGAKSKLCGDQRHLAVVPAADPTKLYALSIPVSGMKGLREYFQQLRNFGFQPEEVVTELGFDDSTSYPRVTFRHAGFLSTDGIAQVETLQRESAEQIKEVTRVKPLSGAEQATISAPSAPAAALLATPTAAEEAAVEADISEDVETSESLNDKLDDLFGS